MATIIGIVYGVLAILPIFVGDVPFIMNILIMCLIWAVVASSWDVIMLRIDWPDLFAFFLM